MPIYAYKCSSCGHTQDVLQKLSAAPLTDCPACGKSAYSKQVTAPQFQLKGSGWYATDFKGGNSGKDNKKDGGKDSEKDSGTESAKPDAKPATATDTKSETKTEAGAASPPQSTPAAVPKPAPAPAKPAAASE
jgi:putative FmdB family regulatory protein